MDRFAQLHSVKPSLTGEAQQGQGEGVAGLILTILDFMKRVAVGFRQSCEIPPGLIQHIRNKIQFGETYL